MTRGTQETSDTKRHGGRKGHRRVMGQREHKGHIRHKEDRGHKAHKRTHGTQESQGRQGDIRDRGHRGHKRDTKGQWGYMGHRGHN